MRSSYCELNGQIVMRSSSCDSKFPLPNEDFGRPNEPFRVCFPGKHFSSAWVLYLGHESLKSASPGNALGTVRSVFQNLRLGSIKLWVGLTHRHAIISLWVGQTDRHAIIILWLEVVTWTDTSTCYQHLVTSPRNPRFPIYRLCLQTTFPVRMSIFKSGISGSACDSKVEIDLHIGMLSWDACAFNMQGFHARSLTRLACTLFNTAGMHAL